MNIERREHFSFDEKESINILTSESTSVYDIVFCEAYILSIRSNVSTRKSYEAFKHNLDRIRIDTDFCDFCQLFSASPSKATRSLAYPKYLAYKADTSSADDCSRRFLLNIASTTTVSPKRRTQFSAIIGEQYDITETAFASVSLFRVVK